ncbi:MAG: DUF6282 family protein [Chloroflexota bacterium]
MSNEVVKRILQGAVDMHMHAAPDPRAERSVDAYQAAVQARDLGMGGIVLKSHEYPTAPVAQLVGKLVPGIAVVGSLSLDYGVGGLNPHAVEWSAKMGARVVWMPTFDSVSNRKAKGMTGGVPLLGEDGRLLPQVQEVLEVVKKYDMVLCTGHISEREVRALSAEVFKSGISRYIMTHPFSHSMEPLSLDLQKDLAEKGAVVEHCFVATTAFSGRLDPRKIVEAVKFVGAERCLLSTDFGQAFNPTPAEGMRVMVATMLQCGLTEKELSLLVKENPRRLLGLGN